MHDLEHEYVDDIAKLKEGLEEEQTNKETIEQLQAQDEEHESTIEKLQCLTNKLRKSVLKEKPPRRLLRKPLL